jgi:deazaflavin-dependent oxidoreductase (nitroreductase family)
MAQHKDRDNRILRAMIRAVAPLHRRLYRATGGRLGRNWANDRMPVLLLTTTGRRTGQARTWPVGYMQDGQDYVIVASNGGLPKHPAWFLNLQTTPRATIEVGAARREVLARIAEGTERERLWARIVEHFPNFATYQAGVTRQLPVVVLRPV